jgi:anti-sigma regulatory factor (Ser/Thr protein kinase)
MSFAANIVPIVALSIPIVAIWTRHKTRIAEMQINAAAQQNAEQGSYGAAQIAQLEERVRVLERIVTDRGYDLAQQIEALRSDEGRSLDTRQPSSSLTHNL